MAGPTRREILEAVRAPDAHVVVLSPDGFELAGPENIRPALSDPAREVVILDGPGWADYAHLMDAEHRQTEDPPSPTPSPPAAEAPPDDPGETQVVRGPEPLIEDLETGETHDYVKVWDAVRREYAWRPAEESE